MALIQISNLNAAGNDLLAGTESFLTELQDTDITQIIGGGGHGHGCGGGSKKGSKKSKKRSGGCGYCH